MAYRIFCGPGLEPLVARHRDLFTPGLFDSPQPLVVLQSQNLGQWLKLHLADTLGSAPSPQIHSSDSALRLLLEAFPRPENQKIVFMDNLKTLLFFLLDEVLKTSDNPAYLPLASYAGGRLAGKTLNGTRVFELADHIAGTFFSYSMNSPDLTTHLAKKTCPDFIKSPGARQAWEWQCLVWEALFAGGQYLSAGLEMARIVENHVVPREKLPPLVLAGSVFLSRRASAFLHHLAREELLEVDQLLVLPASLKPQVPGEGPPRDQRPWGTWAAFGRAFLETFPPLDFQEDPTVKKSFLSRLQASLRRGEPLGTVENEGSLKIISCTHPLRELEVLKEELLTWVSDHREVPLNQIAVMAPDMNRYAGFLDTVFHSGVADLAYHVVDLKMRDDSSFYQALEDLMALFSAPMERSGIFNLIRHPEFQRAKGIQESDVERWLDFTHRASIFRQKTESGGAHTWTAAAERFYAGMALEPPPGPEKGWTEEKLFPLDGGSGWTASLGTYFQTMAEWEAGQDECRGEKNFPGWIDFLGRQVGRFLAEGEEGNSWNELCARLVTLGQDLGDEISLKGLTWPAFAAFVRDQVSHFYARKGRLLTQGIHFSSLKPLRALPFQLIAILGLNEGDFPGGFQPPAFDLRRYEPGQEALSSASLDRFTFWETLSAAREGLWLFYQGRDPQTGANLSPSSLVSDLLDYLEDQGCAQEVQVRAVHPFEDKELLGHGTFSPRVVCQYQALLGEAPPQASLSFPPGEEEDHPQVGPREIRQAFLTPTRFYLRNIQKITLAREDRRADEEEEPWVLDHWEEEAYLEELLIKTLQGKEKEEDTAQFYLSHQLAGEVPSGSFAHLDREALVQGSASLFAQVCDWRQRNQPRKIQPAPGLWGGKPWAPPALWQTPSGWALVQRKRTPALKMKNQWSWALDVLPFFLNPPPDWGGCQLVLFTADQNPTYTWKWDRERSRALAQEAQDYWNLVKTQPLPFYPDLVETLVKMTKDNPKTEEVFPDAWDKTLKDFRSYPDSSSLKDCPYARWALNPTAGDFHRWAEVFDHYAPTLFIPLGETWEKAPEEEP